MVIPVSGTQTNPITIHFESNAILSAPAVETWINAYGQNWITIDGGTNGVIENTDNGSPPPWGTFGHQLNTTGILDCNNCCVPGAAGNGITVQNLTIQNLYVRTPSSTDPMHKDPYSYQNGDGSGICLGGNNVTVANSTVSYAQSGITIAGNNVTVSSNVILACNHFIEIPGGAGSSMSTMTFMNNIIDGMDVWEIPSGTPDLGFHRDGLFFQTDGVISNVYISRNHIGPGFNPKTSDAGSAAIWFGGSAGPYGTYNNVYVFNNVLNLKPPLAWSDGAGGVGGAGSNALVANNTSVSGGDLGVALANETYYNNIIDEPGGSAIGVNVTPAGTNIKNTINIDYNVYANEPTNVGWGPFVEVQNGSNVIIDPTLGQWQIDTAWDLHSSSADPSFVNPNPAGGDYHLQAGSPALSTGKNLTSYCSLAPQLATLCQDWDGNQRPASGAWNIGAYGQCTSNCPAPGPPSILVQPQNTTVTLNVDQYAGFQVVATGNPAPTYQWWENGVLINGATQSNYLTQITSLSQSGSIFRCVVTNANGTVTSSSATLTVGSSPPAPPAPSISTPTAVGLYAAVVYSNPVVSPYNPVIRICPGVVDSVNATIFDVSGRAVNSSSQFAGPFVPASGEGSGQYCYEYTWTGHIASGVYMAVVHAHGSGTTVKAKLKFAVVR